MKPLEELIDTLNEMVTAHQGLLQLAKKKKETLISGSIHELASIVQEESESIAKITELDRRRNECVDDFLKHKGIVPEPMALSDMMKLVEDEETKESLEETGYRLREVVSELKELNTLNQQLLEQSLSYVNFSLDMLTESPDQDMTYSDQKPGGGKGAGSSRRFFDTKA